MYLAALIPAVIGVIIDQILRQFDVRGMTIPFLADYSVPERATRSVFLFVIIYLSTLAANMMPRIF